MGTVTLQDLDVTEHLQSQASRRRFVLRSRLDGTFD
jgi:hypothetical protein